MPSQAVPLATFNGACVLPLYRGREAVSLPVNLPPGVSYPAGQLLIQAAAAANDVQTLTVTGTPTGGTLTLAGTHPRSGAAYTVTLNFNSTVAQTQAALNAALGESGLITVGGGTLPGATQTFTGAGLAAGVPIPVMTVAANALTGGSTPAGAVAHTTTGAAAGTFSAYTGSGTARCVLQYPSASDGSGYITLGAAATGDFWGLTRFDTPAWFGGYFDPADLVGLDATAVGQLGRMLAGAYNSPRGSGILKIN
jgi:hypothetical protein